MTRPSSAFHCFLLATTFLGTTVLGQDTTTVAQAATVRTFTVPGSSTQVRINGTTSTYSRDGGRSWRAMQPIDTQLHLRYGQFDPLVDGAPAIPVHLQARADNRLFIVQFETQVLDAFKADIKSLGGEVRHYLPMQSVVVRMDSAIAARVAQRNYVRWVSPLHVAYKLDPELFEFAAAPESGASRLYNVMMVNDVTDRQATLDAITQAGGEPQPDSGMGILQVGTLDNRQLLSVAGDSSVLWIDHCGEAEVDIDNARIQGGANHIENVGGIDGKGMTGMVMEGVYGTHVEFAARAPYRGVPVGYPGGTAGQGHGTNTAGEIYARGARPDAKGLTPYAQMLYCNYGTVMNNNLRKTVTQWGIQNHGEMYETASWGYPRTTQYTTRSAEMDDIIFDLDVVVTQSQSNAGNTQSRPQAWAKNIMGIGGFRHGNNATNTDDRWSSSGSTGPAADGRLLPTLSAYYDSILTTSGSGSSYTTGFGGTSGATPIINGYAGLTAQMFAEGAFGYPGGNWQTLFNHRGHHTTIKALLVNSAVPGPQSDMHRYRQGWGFPDVQTMWDNRTSFFVDNETSVLLNGQFRDYLVFARGGRDLRVTMTHAEPEAAPNAAITRINSVDLRVETAAGAAYNGNNGLNRGQGGGDYSTSGGSINDRDTLENVFIQNAARGIYGIRVTAAAVRQDNHIETRVNDLDYALIVSQVAGGSNRDAATLDLGSTGPGNFSVTASNPPAGWTGGFTLFSITTTRPRGIGNLFGIEWDGLVEASFTQPTAVGNVFAFLAAGASASDYPNAPYTFPAAIANLLTGRTLDAIALYYGASGRIIDVSNVSRVTIQ